MATESVVTMTLSQQEKIAEIEAIKIEVRVKQTYLRILNVFLEVIKGIKGFMTSLIREKKYRWFHFTLLLVWLVFILLLLGLIFN